jgi:hypothetical protein
MLPDHLWLKTLDIFSEWYDIVDEFHGQNLIMHHDRAKRNPTKALLRLKPQYREKMIKAGYSKS